MGMSRCYSLMKCLLILFNIVFLVVGTGACALTGWALWDGRAGEAAANRAALAAVAGWGAALALAALAALAGAARHSASLLAAAFALLALTAVAEGAAAWWGAAHVPQLRTMLTQRLHHTLRHEYGLLPTHTHVLDAIQQGLECCGAESTRDWQSSEWSRAAAETAAAAAGDATLDLSVTAPAAYYTVPTSCCATSDPAECEISRRVPAASGGAAGLYSAPCGARALAALQQYARGPLCAGAALLAAHGAALLLALAMCLRHQPRAHYKA